MSDAIVTHEEEMELTQDQIDEHLLEVLGEEEYEQLDEISKKTLGSYISKAANDIGFHMYDAGSAAQRQVSSRMGGKEPDNSDFKGAHASRMKAVKRLHGVQKATKRLTKESVDEMLSAAHENQPVQFAQAFGNAMAERISARLDELRPEVAANLFGEKE